MTSKNYSIFYNCNDEEDDNSGTENNNNENYVSVVRLQKPKKIIMKQPLSSYQNSNRKKDYSFEDKTGSSLFKTNVNFHSNPFRNNNTLNPMKNIWLKSIKKKVLNTPKKSHNNSRKKKNNENIMTPDLTENIIDNNDLEEIKDSVTCYICLMKVNLPQMCPFCHHIACQKCLYNWFITKKNHCCSFCRREMEYDEMISVPFMKGIANLIEKISPNDNDNNPNVTLSYEKKSCTTKKLASSKSVIKQKTLKKSLDNFGEVDYCERHRDQPLSYYCYDCDKAYCGTCFVFFGDEKDNHQTHRIMDYKKYKNLNISEIKEKSEYLESKYDELNSYIKRCETMKDCYEFEKKVGEKQIQILNEEFSNYINDKINVINDTIKELKNSLFEIEKAQKEIKKFFNKIESMRKSSNLDLINRLNMVVNAKYLNSREIDNYNNMEKKLKFDIYYTSIKKFEIKEKNFHFSLNFDNSIYKLSITKKANEVQIYTYWPEEIEEDTKYIRVPMIFLRKKNRNWESFRLSEELKYKGNNYFIKRFNVNNFCGINSYFKIKGIMYEIVYD